VPVNQRLAGLVLVLASCRGGGTPAPPDAAVSRRPVDAGVPVDAVTTPLAIDFTVSGCPKFEAAPRCTGRAPLTLEFVPLGTASVTNFLWDFGDGTPKSSARVAAHTYAFPGTYDVRLVGGGVAGSAPRTRAGFVVVTANATGEACDVDQQCETGTGCVCGSKRPCSAAFTRGLCASVCPGASCRAGEVCADLTLGAPAEGREPWQQALCLRACRTDDDCAPGLRCRDLPSPSPPGSWARACFLGAPGPPGSACRNASGQLRSDACITGQCADLGARGLCSLDCTHATCPPGSACADFSDGRRLCLQRCTGGVACDRDPLLACVAPNAGPLGFSVAGAAGGAGTYCAPKICTKRDECGPAGVCRADQNGGHCVRRE
jgi:PKD repeat protein